MKEEEKTKRQIRERDREVGLRIVYMLFGRKQKH
jgi:hypothetical protein